MKINEFRSAYGKEKDRASTGALKDIVGGSATRVGSDAAIAVMHERSNPDARTSTIGKRMAVLAFLCACPYLSPPAYAAAVSTVGAGLTLASTPASTSPAASPGAPTTAATTLLVTPYKDALIGLDWNTFVISTAVSGRTVPLTDDLTRQRVTGATIGFATGECGDETWGGAATDALAAANAKRFARANLAYALATGGAAGAFTCATDAGMQKFLAAWNARPPSVLDYDIEGGVTAVDITHLLQRLRPLRLRYPALHYRLTLATLAPNQGGSSAVSLGMKAADGFNAVGDQTMQAVRDVLGWRGNESTWPADVDVNLMVMDYGGADASVCVVADGQCQMGQSAIQAAMNLHDRWHVPYANIELTPMIGLNDVTVERFTTQDATTVVQWARRDGLSALHYWSYDRDDDCAAGWASPTCNSMGGGYAGRYGYWKAFQAAMS